MNNDEIITNGFKFKCELCAQCCRNWEGSIYISIYEINKIAEKLNLTLEEVFNKFIHTQEEIFEFAGEKLDLTYLAVNQLNGRCIFLDDDFKCAINEFKPFLCKIYPFWSIIMKDQIRFNEYMNKCDGFKNKNGVYYDSQKIMKILKNEAEYIENLNQVSLIMNNIDEKQILLNILKQLDPELKIDSDALNLLKNKLMIEKIRILINQAS